MLPAVALLVWRLAPLARGTETLYLRDVLSTHLEMKSAQAEAMRGGSLPLIDPYRAGGQPLLGNPNAVPLYPDNLLYLVASPFWALNAHFWLHLLLAPFAMYWMARAWGLSREGAWAAGVCYALSGYFLSQMSFYNLIGGATLAPALAAACLRLAEADRHRWRAPAVAMVWSLLILAGDPETALLALLLGIGAVATRQGFRDGALLRIVAALGCGTLLAMPQIVECLRIVGASFRGTLGYSAATRTLASLDPRQIAEWLLPFFFGRPDRLGNEAFWGYRFYTDRPPYFFSLYPGILTLALLTAGLCPARLIARDGLHEEAPPGRRGPRRWAGGAVAAGLFFALGRFNPLGSWLFTLGGGMLRYPVKLYLAVALGGALLAGVGFERAILGREPGAARAFRLALGAFAALYLLTLLALALLPGPIESWIEGMMRAAPSSGSAAAERLRWSRACGISLFVLAVLSLAALGARRRPAVGGACLLAAHAGAQILLLAPLLASDAIRPYVAPSPLLDAVPPSALVAWGGSDGLFGNRDPVPVVYPDARGFWIVRRAFQDLFPPAGALRGRRYELDVSPEGLDSFLTTAARDAVRLSDDAGRVRLLAAWGVDRLVLEREIDSAARGQVELVRRGPGVAGPVFVYRIQGAAPEVAMVGDILRAPGLNDAVRMLQDPSFDPRSAVVIPGSAAPARGPRGEVRVLSRGPESLEADTEAPGPGVLVIQRAFLPLYRATVDGNAVPLRVANLHRLAVEVPAGRHRVKVEAGHRPLWASLGGALLGLGALPLLRARPRRPPMAPVR